MKTYKLKSAFRRGSMLAAAFVVAGASLLPAVSSYADALNPLTDRSLTLSSSAPGWDYLDGSGNTEYAAPNSGANGQKTGNTFQFKVSTDGTVNGAVKSMTFQYCQDPAGTCYSPGNNGTTAGSPDTRNADDVAAKKSDLKVAYGTSANAPQEVDNSTDSFVDSTSENANVTAIPNRDDTEGNYIVLYKDTDDTDWTQSTGWTMTVTHNEDSATVAVASRATGKDNFITLSNDSSDLAIKRDGQVKVVFFGTDNNYITNPGEGAFFVKINTYSNDDGTGLIDGGVTVANVMNLGISIQTKVLETMSFSVGTVDPYTLTTIPDDNGNDPGGADEGSQLAIATDGARTTHGTCDPILNQMDPSDTSKSANTLLLGSEDNENSLSVDHTYSTHSYFRLSSNASAGASVYYSGVTLSNTVGDQIKAISPRTDAGHEGEASAPSIGTEQFGLALANNGSPEYAVNYAVERTAGKVYESGADNAANGIATGTGIDASVTTDWSAAGIAGKLPMLQVYDGTGDPGDEDVALTPDANYNAGAGVVNGGSSGYGSINTKFLFDTNSNQIPTKIASEDQAVVDCASGKVRYIANIAATTPAGIYTTKINYIAAPQY